MTIKGKYEEFKLMEDYCMMNRLKSKITNVPIGVKSAIVYTLSVLFSKGLAIITVPIFTRLMTTEQIGVVNLYNSWYSLIGAFATLSLTSGGFAVAMKDYERSRDQYESSVLSLTSLIALFLAGSYFIYPSMWQNVLGLSNNLIILMLIGFFFTPARDFWLARQRYEYKYKLAGIITIFSAIGASVLSIIIVIKMNQMNLKNTAEGRLFLNYIIIYGVAMILWLYVMIKGKTIFNKEYWKMSLSLSIPLVGYSIAAQILNVSDRMMISHMVGNSAVGIYGTLHTISTLSLLVWQAINSSFVPYLFQNIEKKGHNIIKISNTLMLIYAIIAVLIIYLAPEIVKILATEEYYEAIYIMPPIAAGVFYTSLANLYSNIAVYYKKTKYVMYPAVVAAILNLILNYIFIQFFGYMAAAYTTLVSYIILAFLQVMWGKKICKDNNNDINKIYDNKKLATISIITTLCSLFGILLYSNTVIRYLVIIIGFILTIILIFKAHRSGNL